MLSKSPEWDIRPSLHRQMAKIYNGQIQYSSVLIWCQILEQAGDIGQDCRPLFKQNVSPPLMVEITRSHPQLILLRGHQIGITKYTRNWVLVKTPLRRLQHWTGHLKGKPKKHYKNSLTHSFHIFHPGVSPSRISWSGYKSSQRFLTDKTYLGLKELVKPILQTVLSLIISLRIDRLISGHFQKN